MIGNKYTCNSCLDEELTGSMKIENIFIYYRQLILAHFIAFYCCNMHVFHTEIY